MPTTTKLERPVLGERHHLEDCPESDRNARTETFVSDEPPSPRYPAGRKAVVIRCKECGGHIIQKGA